MSFKCSVLTPEQQVVDDTVSQVVLPAHDGQIGILTGRAPILVKLGWGELKITAAGGKTSHYYLEAGVAQMKDNVLTVLTEKCVPVADIDTAAAKSDLEKGTVMHPSTAAASDAKRRLVEGAKARLALARK